MTCVCIFDSIATVIGRIHGVIVVATIAPTIAPTGRGDVYTPYNTGTCDA